MAERITIIINAQAGQAVKEFQAVASNVTQAAEIVQQAGMRLSMGITLPIVGGAAAALKAAATWDTAVTGMAKTVEAPIARVRRLGEEFKDLSEQIPVAAVELANIGAQAGQLGIETEAIMGFTQTVAALAVSTNLTAEAAGNALARMANIMGTSQKDFSRMGSSIVELGNNLATTEAEITEFGLRMAGAGKIAGFRESDILAIGAALSSVGVEAEAGGTSVQKAMITINTAVATGAGDVAQFARVAGMSAEEFAATWRGEPVVAFSAFIEGLGREGDLAAQTLEDLIAGDQRLARAFLSLSKAGDLLERSVKLSSDAWAENTALTKESQKFYERLAAGFIEVANKAKNVAAELGEGIAPGARLGASAVSGLLDVARVAVAVFSALPVPIRTTVVGVAALAAAAGPAMIAVSGLMRAWAMFAGLKAASVAIPLVTAGIARLAVVVPTLTLALRTLGSTTVIGAVVTGVALLAAAFARANSVAQEAADHWRSLLGEIQGQIAGMDLTMVSAMAEGATRQLKSAERFKEELDRLEALEAKRKPHQEGGLLVLGGGPRDLAREARIDYLKSVLGEDDIVLERLRAKVAVLVPEVERLTAEAVKAAEAEASITDQTGKAAVAFGRSVRLGFTELADVQKDLTDRLKKARQELYALEVSQGTVAEGTDTWKEMGESVAKARTEIQLVEGALARVTGELERLTTARIGALDFTPKTLGNLRLGLPIPNLAGALGLPQAPGGLPGTLAPSASLQTADFIRAQRQSAQASAFGMGPEQFEQLQKAANAAGLSTEEYAKTLGIVTQAQMDWENVAITGMGAVVAAFAGGMDNIKVVVVNAMTNLMQTLSQKDGPLGSIFGGFGVPIFGAIGGVLAAVLSKRNDRQKVEVDRYSQSALEQQKTIQPPPQSVQVVLVDSRGNEIRRVSSELKRLTALDGVTRLPDYMPAGG